MLLVAHSSSPQRNRRLAWRATSSTRRPNRTRSSFANRSGVAGLTFPNRRMTLPPGVSPRLYDVEALTSPRVIAASRERQAWDWAANEREALPAARVAYVLPWGNATAALVADALGSGIRVRHASSATVHARGTQLCRRECCHPRSENDADLAIKLERLIYTHGAEAVAVPDGYQDEGISLGSVNVRALKAPRVLMAWDAPTSGRCLQGGHDTHSSSSITSRSPSSGRHHCRV